MVFLCRPGSPVIRVFALDRDDPASPNADLYYTLVSQIPNKQHVAFFQINHQTGEISTTEQGERRFLFLPAASVICPSPPVIRQYSAAVNPDYMAHRALKIKVRLPERDVSVDCSDHEEVDIWERRFSCGFEVAKTRL